MSIERVEYDCQMWVQIEVEPGIGAEGLAPAAGFVGDVRSPLRVVSCHVVLVGELEDVHRLRSCGSLLSILRGSITDLNDPACPIPDRFSEFGVEDWGKHVV